MVDRLGRILTRVSSMRAFLTLIHIACRLCIRSACVQGGAQNAEGYCRCAALK